MILGQCRAFMPLYDVNSGYLVGCHRSLREGCGKSKWKFKMAFAMKGGGSRGGLECHIPILKNDFS